MGSSRSQIEDTAARVAMGSHRAAVSLAAGFAADASTAQSQHSFSPAPPSSAATGSGALWRTAVENLRSNSPTAHSMLELFDAS